MLTKVKTVDNGSSLDFAAVMLMSAAVFFALALRHDALYLVGSFLSLSGAALKNVRQRTALLVTGLALALLVAGYSMGKQLALRDARMCTITAAAR